MLNFEQCPFITVKYYVCCGEIILELSVIYIIRNVIMNIYKLKLKYRKFNTYTYGLCITQKGLGPV
jgi:hypothetical protein